jgi:hypothetical protein
LAILKAIWHIFFEMHRPIKSVQTLGIGLPLQSISGASWMAGLDHS